MRVHFSSAVPCALKLAGALAGFCGETEKFADIPDGERVLAEFIPESGELFPLSFVIDGAFFAAPPRCCDVYRYDCGADLFAARFSPRERELRVRAQIRAGDILATVLDSGGASLSLENKTDFQTYALPPAEDYDAAAETIGGESFLRVLCRGGRHKELLLFNERLECVFRDRVSDFSCTDKLTASFEFSDIAGHTSVRTFRAEGGALLPDSQQLHAKNEIDPAALDERILPFAFFQEIAAGGDCGDYLAPCLADKKDRLMQYLGEFCGVYLPKEIFYLTHGRVNAAGLIYKHSEHVFDIKYFSVHAEKGKIDNIIPVE